MSKIARAVGKILLFLSLWAAGITASVMIAVAIGGRDFPDQLPLRFGVEAGGAISCFVALAFMARVIDRRGWDTIGLPLRWSGLSELLIGTVLGAAIFAVPIVILVALGAARLDPDWRGFTLPAFAYVGALCFVNVVDQELLVRSYMFQELWTKFGVWIAAIVTTIIFVALHAAAIMQGAAGVLAGFNVALASVLLSLAVARTRALWLPIGIHFGWNGLQGPVLGIDVTGTDIGVGHWRAFTFPGSDLLTGGAMGVEGGLAGLAGPLLGIGLVALLVKQRPPQAALREPLAA